MGFKLLYAGFHTPKAVTYHEPTAIWLFMIGHSLGRMETFFGWDLQHLRCWEQNTSQIQILRLFEKGEQNTFKKKGAMHNV